MASKNKGGKNTKKQGATLKEKRQAKKAKKAQKG
jgi:hypothetical protein